jgi:hypothetical protein
MPMKNPSHPGELIKTEIIDVLGRASRRNNWAHAPSAPYVRSNNSSLPPLTSNSHRVTNKVVPSPALGSWQFLLNRKF